MLRSRHSAGSRKRVGTECRKRVDAGRRKSVGTGCRAARGCAFVTAALVAGCATQPLDPAKNSINRAINTGGEAVTGSIRALNRDQVRALATSFPVCIAYQLRNTAPALNDTFKRTLSDVTGTLKPEAKAPVTISVYQAQMKRAVNPLAELVALKGILPAAYRSGRMDYQPLPAPEFRKRATCNGKDTVLVVGDDVTFYRKELPLATVAAGELAIDTILFVVLDAAMPARAAIDEPGRPS